MIRINLPLPPSSNNAYINVLGRGRVPSQAHKSWKHHASWAIAIFHPGTIGGPYRFTIYLPLKMRGDVSNRIKLAEDLLVTMGVTPDDKHAVSVHSERSADVAPGWCVITISEAGANDQK